VIAAGCIAPLQRNADGNSVLIQSLIKEELKVKLQNFLYLGYPVELRRRGHNSWQRL